MVSGSGVIEVYSQSVCMMREPEDCPAYMRARGEGGPLREDCGMMKTSHLHSASYLTQKGLACMDAELITMDDNVQMLLTSSCNVDAVFSALTIKSMGVGVEYIHRNGLAIFRFLRTDLPEINTLTILLKSVGFTNVQVLRFTAIPRQ